MKRYGARNKPLYQIVVLDQAKKRDGACLEVLGQYRPRAEKPSEKLTLNRELYSAWVAKGAQVSQTVGQLFRIASK